MLKYEIQVIINKKTCSRKLEDRQAKWVKAANPLADLKWQKERSVYYYVVKRSAKKSRPPRPPSFLVLYRGRRHFRIKRASSDENRILFDEDLYNLVVICLKKSALQILSDAGFFTNGKTSCLANL